MKTTEKKDLQTKTKAELVKLLQDAQAALMQLKLDHQQNKLENTSAISNTRNKIAVIKTIMTIKAVETPVVEKTVDEKKANVKKGGKE